MSLFAVFRSDRFNMSWPQDEALPPGRDALLHLREHLHNRGVQFDKTGPYKVLSTAWLLDAWMERTKLHIQVQLLPIGEPSRNHWIISIWESLGWLKSALLPWRKRSATELLKSRIDDLLREANVEALQWLTKEEFTVLVRRGTP